MEKSPYNPALNYTCIISTKGKKRKEGRSDNYTKLKLPDYFEQRSNSFYLVNSTLHWTQVTSYVDPLQIELPTAQSTQAKIAPSGRFEWNCQDRNTKQ